MHQMLTKIPSHLRKLPAKQIFALAWSIALLPCFTAAATLYGMDSDAAAAAAALGVIRTGASEIENSAVNHIVSIDFDIPRYGPVCISVNDNDDLEFVWEEYHNLHQLPDELSFRDCDFSNAVALVPEGMPNPLGYEIEAAAVTSTARYFSCSKICASNGHKIKVCAGGNFGQDNECSATAECDPDRTIDLRRMDSVSSLLEQSRDGYVPVGKVCRPKNGDGYSITSGLDTPESCRQKCDEDSDRCGAWEFEDYDADNKECELHEFDVISYEETLAMGECLTSTTGDNDGDYRCCWIAEDIVKLQTDADSTNVKEKIISSGASELEPGPKHVVFPMIMTVASLVISHTFVLLMES